MRIAIVTGASSGLGREFAKQVTALYHHLDEIWIVARRNKELEQLSRELSVPVRIICGDLEQNEIYNRINIELEGHDAKICILINNAGFGKMGDAKGLLAGEQLAMIDLNCYALTRMTLLCLPYMGKGTRLIQVASAAAFAPQPGFCVYAATKSYVYSFSRALGKELKTRGIIVTTVCPGPVETEFFERAGKYGKAEKYKRMAKADAVVKKALFDAVHGKAVSVYGTGMKAARIGAKLLPATMVMTIMRRLNTKD